jgi:hypothetical protein
MAFSVARDERSAPFFDAAADGVLLVRRCPDGGRTFAPHVHACVEHGVECEWVPAKGTATLVTWSVDPSPPLDRALATPDGTSSIVGMVELAEGPWMYAAIVEVDATSLVEGARLEVQFVRPGDGEAVPVFTPAR